MVSSVMIPSFSSRFSLVLTGFVITLLLSCIFIAIEEASIIPSIRTEYDRRVTSLPNIIATANQQALASNDLATLQTTLDGIMEQTAKSGVRYIFIQDADGQIIAEVFAQEIDEKEKTGIVTELRTLYGSLPADLNKKDKEQAEKTRLEIFEEEAARNNAPKAADDVAANVLPLIEKTTSWRFITGNPPLIDYTVPITMGAISFGGVRVGVFDEASAIIRHIRTVSWSAVAGAFLLVQLLIVYLRSHIDSGFEKTMDTRSNLIRKELEIRIKQLEVDQTRREEDNPVSPSEFLAMLDFARKISGTLDYNEVLNASIHSCLQVLGVRDVSIFVMDPDTNELVGRIGHDENGFMDETEMSKIRVPLGKGDIGTAAEFGTTTMIDSPKPGSGVVSGLLANGRTIGVILVRSKISGRPFIKKDQMLLRLFSGLLANAMETTALFHHLNAR